MIVFNPARNPCARSLLFVAPSTASATVPFRLTLGATLPKQGKNPEKCDRSGWAQPHEPSKDPLSGLRSNSENPEEDSELGSKPKRQLLADFEELDPVHRQLASFSPPIAQATNSLDPAAAQRFERVRVATIDEVFNTLVRRVGWSLGNDRRSGALRIEIASGELEGCTLIISKEPHELRIELDAPPGVDVEVWKNRLSRRLASHGLRASLF